jgi:hypothetical protein
MFGRKDLWLGSQNGSVGVKELHTGIVCVDNFKARGNKKTEAKNPQLGAEIVTLAEPESQTDPKFQTTFNKPALHPRACVKHLLRTKAGKLKTCRVKKLSAIS